MTNKVNTVLYVGVCSDLIRRIWQHKNKLSPDGFTNRYHIDKLVYYEIFEDINEAINREKQLKGGSRGKKVKLVEAMNPTWKDLYQELT